MTDLQFNNHFTSSLRTGSSDSLIIFPADSAVCYATLKKKALGKVVTSMDVNDSMIFCSGSS